MTKEELESKFEDCFDDCTQSSEGGYGADTTNMNRLWKSFLPAISEYAKQQAIAFGFHVLGADPADPEMGGIDAMTKTYDSFIEQQNKP